MEQGPESSGEGVLGIVGSLGLEEAGVNNLCLVSTLISGGRRSGSTVCPLI